MQIDCYFVHLKRYYCFFAKQSTEHRFAPAGAYWIYCKLSICSFLLFQKKHKIQSRGSEGWLKKVLEVIPEYKVSKLHELLPQNLKL